MRTVSAHQVTEFPNDQLLTGQELRDALASASRHLRDVASAIDAINVYPVPDGDTGANMAGTLHEAVEASVVAGEDPPVHEVLQALARGALFGARGNSGVILSQALRGFAQGTGEVERFDAAALARGLEVAAREAYAAVATPQEGTMLTVLRAAAEEASRRVAEQRNGGAGEPCGRLLASAIQAAEEAEAKTIDQLQELREAGVPDAGGEGICVILRGLLAAITGTTAAPPDLPSRPIATLASHALEEFGYCAEFLVEREGEQIDVEAVRQLATSPENRSVVVVGDAQLVHVHVHTDAPEILIERAAAFGRVSRVKIDDMTAQHVKFAAAGSGAVHAVAVLAMSRGQGFDAIFESLGARVSDLGEVEKPAAGQIATAADAIGAPDVMVLPNHKNVMLAARQAQSLTRCTLHVVPATTLPEGVAATIAFNPDETATANLEEMARAVETVRTVEVTIAAADRTADGVSVRKGEAITIVDGRLVGSAADPVQALLMGLRRAGAEEANLVTIYTGRDRGEDGAALAKGAVETEFRRVEVEFHYGGQPLYPFIASVEN
jgi:uncharacterized protein